jgi:hypothetical protein
LIWAAIQDRGGEVTKADGSKVYLAQMPPFYPLPAEAKQAVREWILAGAPDLEVLK